MCDFHDCRVKLWIWICAFSTSVREWTKSKYFLLCGYLFIFYFFRGLFSRAENFVIFYQGLWDENVNILVQNSPTLFFFFFTFISRVFSLFLRDLITFEIKFSNITSQICIYGLYWQILVNRKQTNTSLFSPNTILPYVQATAKFFTPTKHSQI